MPIRIFCDISTLGTQRISEPNNNIDKPVEQSNGIRINRGRDDSSDFKISEGLNAGNRILQVTRENLNAASSTIQERDVAKKIAILTRNYILETASGAVEEQTSIKSQTVTRHLT